MVVLSVYLARSNTGRGVFVGNGVSVGCAGVFVAGNSTKACSVFVGLAVPCGVEQAERIKMMASRERMVFLLFCMGAILPLVKMP